MSAGGTWSAAAAFDDMFTELEPVGRHRPTGGFRRYAWGEADLECRTWFTATAAERGLEVEADGNGNLWAWIGSPGRGDALVLGSHLDSVPDGGAFDGPLGVIAAFAAVDLARSRAWVPSRPVAIVAFSDEEGARFGVACAGSRLMTGALDPDRALGLRDRDGVRLSEAMRAAGHDPAAAGRDRERVGRIGRYVELHVEQGRMRIPAHGGDETVAGLAGYGSSLGLGSVIWPHGRWRFELTGRADHAGSTALADRDDPMLRYARAVLAARQAAEQHDAVATVARVEVEPGAVNAIPSLVRGWLDARGADESRVRDVATEVFRVAGAGAVHEESWTPSTRFDADVTGRIADVLTPRFGRLPTLPTGAGHDAGVLAAAGIPAAMIYVRNPTGVSHSPAEYAEAGDCVAGVEALARVLEALG